MKNKWRESMPREGDEVRLTELLSALFQVTCEATKVHLSYYLIYFYPEQSFETLQGYKRLLNLKTISTEACDSVFVETIKLSSSHLRIFCSLAAIIEKINNNTQQAIHINDAIEPLSRPPALNRTSRSTFFSEITNGLSQKLQQYINSFANQETFQARFERLNIKPQQELFCAISKDIPNIPVLLDGQSYDWEYLEKLPVVSNGRRTNPMNREKFILAEVMPARVISDLLESQIKKAETNTPALTL